MADIFLKENPTLADLQAFVAMACKARGFGDETVSEKIMLLAEEVGELAKAVRKTTGVVIDPKSEKYRVDLEAVDVVWYVLDLCNRYGIDLEKAFREKEELNRQRIWHNEKTAA